MGQQSLGVTLGVDTHRDTHTAAAVDQAGRTLGCRSFPTSTSGYRALLAWAQSFGPLERAGVEGTGCWGAGLTRYLLGQGVEVLEVIRPHRRDRRHRGKSDPLDAEAAARAALNGTTTNPAKTRDGRVESLRALKVARDGAVKARTAAAHQLASLVVAAPEPLRAQLQPLKLRKLVAQCARFRAGDAADPAQATKLALRSIAQRWTHLTDEITELERELRALVAAVAPQLLELTGVGVNVAAALLVTAGDNPGRVRNEGAFAHLCGVAPLPASSGRVVRHRLNPGGDRRANNALYTIVLTRMRIEERTRAYVTRRTSEGLSKREIIRCLKRYVAREIYQHLATGTAPPAALT